MEVVFERPQMEKLLRLCSLQDLARVQRRVHLRLLLGDWPLFEGLLRPAIAAQHSLQAGSLCSCFLSFGRLQLLFVVVGDLENESFQVDEPALLLIKLDHQVEAIYRLVAFALNERPEVYGSLLELFKCAVHSPRPLNQYDFPAELDFRDRSLQSDQPVHLEFFNELSDIVSDQDGCRHLPMSFHLGESLQVCVQATNPQLKLYSPLNQSPAAHSLKEPNGSLFLLVRALNSDVSLQIWPQQKLYL